ncbi:DNA sulfur modification protein DndB [Pyxidicoccus caerfyrddinensis]|uniref:DNA sulfur modification protein DndB n=1 Tax=Pyxidicoccus caerfyrddinensis TaxID=2709663 RepID=UPI0013DC27B4|nr:DNA sulfur modification protein DndB [Pyxidicoccus caerfyrddinensis]
MIPYLEVNQKQHAFILAKINAGRLAQIAYVAVRGKDNEPGAVQRLLNPDRISSIKEFTVNVGDYPSALVLNWTNKENPLVKNNGTIDFEDVPRSAQLIDGQHRLAGIKEAIQENPEIAQLELPVAIYEYLDTKECANIFLSINTEQKPVPRSLVYDLYGIANENMVDAASVRARDIASYLNEEKSSPYFEGIKFPGSPRRRGGIALSTAVGALKPLVEEKGGLAQVGITEFELQKLIVINFFNALQSLYTKHWEDRDNVFLYAAGFVGAIDFLRLKMVPYCNIRKSFKTELMQDSMKLNPANLILQSEVKGLGGKDAPKRVYERLTEAFKPDSGQPTVFEF